MKKPKKRQCQAKGCLTYFAPINSFSTACSPKCAIKIIQQKKEEKEKNNRKIDKVKKDALRPMSYWAKRAQKAFNEYIRLRDRNEPCISCRRHHKKQWHCSHYQSVGSTPWLRFHPFNGNRSCSACNNFLSGNIAEYRKHLINKIGVKNVEWLESFSSNYRFTKEDYLEIHDYFKKLSKEIKVNL